MGASDAKPLLTATDSLAYQIDINDFYKMIQYAKRKLDISLCPTDHPSCMPVGMRKKVARCAGNYMTEFVRLCASINVYKVEKSKRCEGKCFIDNWKSHKAFLEKLISSSQKVFFP
jgi:hypothetical protein